MPTQACKQQIPVDGASKTDSRNIFDARARPRCRHKIDVLFKLYGFRLVDIYLWRENCALGRRLSHVSQRMYDIVKANYRRLAMFPVLCFRFLRPTNYFTLR